MFHKAYVIASLNFISFSNGFVYGQVGSLIGSLQRKEEGIDLSEGQISLIASTIITLNIIGMGINAVFTDRFGRRWPYILLSTLIAINWIILYKAKDMNQLMLSRVIAGISVGALWALNVLVPSEYTSPKNRAFYLNMVTTVTPAMGTAFVHAAGIALHWRTVALIGIIPALLGVVLPYFWVESPHWLASKGKFEECESAFRKLHGHTLNSERELQLLIKMERSKLKKASETNCKPTLKRLCLAFKKKYFWGLLIMSIFIHVYNAAAGKIVFSTLATVILEQITGTSDILLFTLIVDGFVIIGSCLSCVLIRRTSMRTLLFSTGFIANATLVIFSACYYFKNDETYFNWINVSLLAFYFIIVNTGPYPVLEAILSEMFPLDLKMYLTSISGIILVLSLSLSVILLPSIVSVMGYHGLFLMNAAIMSLVLGYIWFMLPETKGKTLQEIEMYFKTKNFDINEVLTNEQSAVLI